MQWPSNSWARVGVLPAQPKRRPLNFLEHKNTIYCRTNKNQWKLKNVQSFAAKEEAHRKQAWKQWDKLSHTQSANKPNWSMLPSFGFKERISIVFLLTFVEKKLSNEPIKCSLSNYNWPNWWCWISARSACKTRRSQFPKVISTVCFLLWKFENCGSRCSPSRLPRYRQNVGRSISFTRLWPRLYRSCKVW